MLMDWGDQDLSVLAEKTVYFFDLDGTIYLGDHLFDGVLELVKILREKEKSFYFLSNNSSLSTRDYLKKLNKFNLNITSDNLILSQHPTLDYQKRNGFEKIFLLGTQSLKNEFLRHGFLLTDIDRFPSVSCTRNRIPFPLQHNSQEFSYARFIVHH